MPHSRPALTVRDAILGRLSADEWTTRTELYRRVHTLSAFRRARPRRAAVMQADLDRMLESGEIEKRVECGCGGGCLTTSYRLARW